MDNSKPIGIRMINGLILFILTVTMIWCMMVLSAFLFKQLSPFFGTTCPRVSAIATFSFPITLVHGFILVLARIVGVRMK